MAVCVGPLEAATVAVETPGSLATLLSADELDDADMTVSGIIDVRDLLVIASMPNLTTLDLSGAEIEAYVIDKPTTLDDGNYPADYLPAEIFFGKKLTSVVLPTSLTSIGHYALADNRFASISLPDGLRTIGNFAFYGCDKLAAITLPTSVESVGDYAFAACPALASADMETAAVSMLSPNIFLNDTALAEVKLPSELERIGADAFAGCTSLKNIALPQTLTAVGDNAFAMTALTAIDLPEAVASVGDFAFQRCQSLTTGNVSGEGVSLGEGIFFHNTSMGSFNAKGVTELPAFAFAGDSSLPYAASDAFANITSVGDYALMDNTAVVVITAGPSLQWLGDGAMEGMTSLTKFDATALEDRVPGLGADVFAGIDTPTTELTVAENTGDAWRSAEQWKEFHINELTGIDGTASDSSCIKAWFIGTKLQIEAPDTIESVVVYLANGMKVAGSEPDATRTAIDTARFTDRVYVVSIRTAASSSTFKLIR